MKILFSMSKWIHKWLSIILSIFLIWMSISGILMNHPEIIEDINVPSWLLPHDYDLINWNRSSLIQAEFSKTIKGKAYFAGHEGVVKTIDGGYTFSNLTNNGYPQSAYLKRTKSIALFENDGKEVLFAGNYDGLYKFDVESGYWNKIKLPGYETRVMRLIDIKDSIVVVTDSEIFIAGITDKKMVFRKINLERIDENPSMTMIEFFFTLHSGELWGLPGKIVFDIGGIILIFLSISGLYIWISPKFRKLKLKMNLKNKPSHIGWFFRNHLKIGIWSFVLLLVFAITGLFMRPPLIVALLGNNIALKYIPAANPDNPWKHRIRNAMYNYSTNKFIIDTKDGYWISETGLDGKYINELPPVPIFAMGATVLRDDGRGNTLIGSFAGLYRVRNSGLTAENLLEDGSTEITSIRPGANLITGYFKDHEGYEYVTTHFGGLINVQKSEVKSDKFRMPKFLVDNYSMSLWNYLFELHNGRLFQALVGDYYILIIPLTSLLFIVLILTGVFDWCYRKF